MQRGKDEVAGLGRFSGDLNPLFVPHFAYQDHLRSLPQGGPQGKGEAGSVTVQFSLVNDRPLVAMHEFNGIFDGDDVIRMSFVDPVENRCHGRGLP